MYWGSSATSVLAGIVGGVLLICAVVLARRLGRRRAVGAAGLGLLLLGLSLSGLIEVVARAFAVFSFNPLRWAGLGAAALGFLLLSWSGVLPSRRGRRADPDRSETRPAVQPGKAETSGKAVESPSGKPAVGDDELAEIEEILKRRGIS